MSVVDLACELNDATTLAEICAEMKAQSQGTLNGVLDYTEDKVVASDFRGKTCISVFDAGASTAPDGTFIKVWPGMTTSGLTPTSAWRGCAWPPGRPAINLIPHPWKASNIEGIQMQNAPVG